MYVQYILSTYKNYFLLTFALKKLIPLKISKNNDLKYATYVFFVVVFFVKKRLWKIIFLFYSFL